MALLEERRALRSEYGIAAETWETQITFHLPCFFSSEWVIKQKQMRQLELPVHFPGACLNEDLLQLKAP